MKRNVLSMGLFMLIATIWAPISVKAQKSKNTTQVNTSYYEKLSWRNIGPYRGGRSATVTGVPGEPNLFYFGSTGGGVWRTKDGGQTWANISDDFFGGSIGSVAVSTYDPNVIYVGGGEKTVRGNVSYGYGIWKSEDAGKTWAFKGLKDSRHVARIRIHPKNPDIVYAAVMGDLYKPTSERGVYKSVDGGNTWKKVLFTNENAGAVDLILDPNNPRVLYASTWRIRRTPFSLSSGGEGSALWKSTDGGETWVNLMSKKGMPEGPIGIIGVTVSPVQRDRVWAIIESKEGGVFRSEDGGETWKKTNDDRALRQRAWYYSRIYADTKDADIVYVMNVSYHKSKDGGRTFESFRAPHGDHHDLWIDPENSQRMIIGDDGGAQVSFDGGENWSTYYNQPTAQFYRVTTDNHFPYRIYGAQQDNSAIRIAHRTDGYSIGEKDYESTAGGESAHIAVDPENDDIVYGGSYGGFLTRVNHKTNEVRAINVWPDNPMGHGAEGMKYRFQWNFPIFFSKHDPDKLYAASNHLHVTTNEGQSWTTISPDLTRDDSAKLVSSGGPITQDNTGVEYYCTIFAATESNFEEGTLWTGSDDGLIHITRNGGESWENVTPKDMPEWIMINSIDADPFEKGGAYVAATKYKSGDYQPYLYKTKDYGKTWTKITNDIAGDHFTRVVRADPNHQGILYAGTESGMYISFNDGSNWQPFQLNLPIVPITDLTVKDANLITATQGRGFWIIDDLTPLYQLEEAKGKTHYIFKPQDSYRMDGRQVENLKTAGINHPGGVMLYYYLDQKPDSSQTASLSFFDKKGELIKKIGDNPVDPSDTIPSQAGMNYYNWNMRTEDAKKFDGMVLWWSSMSGPVVVPGEYMASLKVGSDSVTQNFKILADPRITASQEDLETQYKFLSEIRDKVSETHEAITDLRKTRSALKSLKERLADEEDWKALSAQIDSTINELTAIEETLYQTKSKSNQDPLNFPIRLNNKLAHLLSLNGMGDFKPTDQEVELKNELTAKIDEQLEKYQSIKENSIPEINEMVIEMKVPAISAD